MKCKHCGSTLLVKAGIDYQGAGNKPRYKCKACGKITTGEVVEHKKTECAKCHTLPCRGRALKSSMNT